LTELQNFLVGASWHPKRGLVPVCGAYSVPLTGELTLLTGESAAAMVALVKINHYANHQTNQTFEPSFADMAEDAPLFTHWSRRPSSLSDLENSAS
jgi:hypothetical protein